MRQSVNQLRDSRHSLLLNRKYGVFWQDGQDYQETFITKRGVQDLNFVWIYFSKCLILYV